MNQLNSITFSALHSLSGRQSWLDSVIVFVANTLPYLVIAYALYLLYVTFHKRQKGISPRLYFKKALLEAGLLGDSLLLAWLMSFILKIYVAAPRPFIDGVLPLFYYGGYTSFPSGHATLFAAVTFSAFIFHKRQGYLFSFLALIIGAARVAAGVHYPIDIFAGYCLGIVCAWVIQRIARPWGERMVATL